MNVPPWLEWARELQAMSQTGLHYANDAYDRQRYERLAEIAAAITAQHTTLTAAELLDNFAAQPGYATAKIDVRGAVVRDGKILLVQERSDGRWALPGGWADIGEVPSQMVAREVWEESGFAVAVRKVIGVFDANRKPPLQFHYAYKIVFLCEIVGGAARTSEETSAVEFFDFSEPPPLSPFRTDPRHLDEIQAHLADLTRPAAFD